MVKNSLTRRDYDTINKSESDDNAIDSDLDSLTESLYEKLNLDKTEVKESRREEKTIWQGLLTDVVVFCDLLEWFAGLK